MESEFIYLLRILFAVFLGFMIGLERKIRFKEAGIRTHTIVCAGSSLIMIVSKYGFSDSPDFDASRVAAQIVSGIGFLGAGMIIYRRQAIHGLTTAAGVWATAGVGMAAGSGLYIVAGGAALVLIAFQCMMHIRCRLFNTKRFVKLKVCFFMNGDEGETVKQLFSVERFSRINFERREEGVYCQAVIQGEREFGDEYISRVLGENSFIRSVERCDDE